ncbi:MAG: FMN-binding protein [Paludibacter sp.]|nr:FMN-binding protein [Bacteroidales bacterium]MCM1069974.1 FMN-binding protein [Prevotella sp.]MCM1354637.1 FMN-binding protein [Bacteroides sp.]MCM1443578.1 FMN-binding protein [Muribaculum sp.]MCM1482494.1 FMN-binding protein [Paludibacter sp.]
MKKKKFICSVCGYVHIGDNAPEECPQCHQKGVFVAQKQGLDTNSNVYTMIYATVMVIIVAVLLAVVSMALKPKQDANVELDKKKQILSSLNIDLKGQDVEALYTQIINEQQFEGKTYYVATLEDATKYIIPMQGAGLWGAIWGYIALDSDKSTIYGTYFNHDSETPGLGGEITTAKFQNGFVGKHITQNGAITDIHIVKSEPTEEEVQGISGATITSGGVETMINNTIADYAAFLQEQAPATEVETEVTEPSNEEED